MTRIPENTSPPEWKKEMDRKRMRSLADLFPGTEASDRHGPSVAASGSARL